MIEFIKQIIDIIIHFIIICIIVTGFSGIILSPVLIYNYKEWKKEQERKKRWENDQRKI